MKQRFSSLDVKAIVPELSTSLTGLRVSNIYDLSPRTILFKFQKPDVKELFVIETGFRCHTTKFSRETATAPSGFVARLRKFLRTRRVTGIRQIGTDRILEFTFSDGLYRLFFEFYAAGNIILTDENLRIVALQRVVHEGAEHEHVRMNETYNITERQNVNGIPELTRERVREGLEAYISKFNAKAAEAENDAPSKGKMKKKSKEMQLRSALPTFVSELPPALLTHALLIDEVDSALSPGTVLTDETLFTKLFNALEKARQILESLSGSEPSKGYIVSKLVTQKRLLPTDEDAGSNPGHEERLAYDEFHPFRPAQFCSDAHTILEFDTFALALDEFFSTIEGSKLESRLQAKEDAARAKIELARKAHESQIAGLQGSQELNIRKAETIDANFQLVETAVDAVNTLLDRGMDWTNIGKFIEMEQQKKSEVASVIKLPLNLKDKIITLILQEPTEDGGQKSEQESESEWDESDDDEEEITSLKSSRDAKKPQRTNLAKPLSIDIDLTVSVYANMQKYYSQKKVAQAKEVRTAEISTTAMKRQEARIMSDLKKSLSQEKELLRAVRTQAWFEKFYYFFSSEGYLVVSAKDAQQVDLLIKRYLRPGDAFVHADIDQALVVVVKNKLAVDKGEAHPPIPPSTLSQAGTFSICGSKAWDSKAIMSAWWVPPEAITKISNLAKDALPIGGFEVLPEFSKAYLPPAQLLMGLSVVYELDEASQNRRAQKKQPEAAAGQVSSTPPTGATEEASKQNEDRDADGDDSEDSDFGLGSDDDDDDDDFFPDVALDGSIAMPKQTQSSEGALSRPPLTADQTEGDSAAAEEGDLSSDTGLEPVADESQAEDLSIPPYRFVGKLLPNETALGILSVCGPWTALGPSTGHYSSARFKTKLQPGQLKKGKAAREVIHGWQTSARAAIAAAERKQQSRNGTAAAANPDELARDPDWVSPAEHDLVVSALKEAETIGLVPMGKMAVVAGPGAGKGSSSGNGKAGAGGQKGKGKGGSKGNPPKKGGKRK